MLRLQLPQNPATNPHTTNESLTSLDEESASLRSLSERAKEAQCSAEGENVSLRTQVRDPSLYSYLVERVESRHKNEEAESPPGKVEDRIRTRTLKAKRIAKTQPQERSEEEAASDSNKKKRSLEIEVATEPEPKMETNLSGIEGNSNNNRGPSPQDEDVRFMFPASPHRPEESDRAQQQEEVEELKGQAEGLNRRLGELKENADKLSGENLDLHAELSKARAKMQLLEAQNTDLSQRLASVRDVKKEETAAGTEEHAADCEGTQTHTAEISARAVQTDPSESAALQKLTSANTSLESRLKSVEREHSELCSAMEQQHLLLVKAEADLAATVRDHKAISAELQAARQGLDAQRKLASTLKSDASNYKARALRLETENRELQQRMGRKQYGEDTLERYKQLAEGLAKENELQKTMLDEAREQLQRRGDDRKQREKVKDLRKERDLLKIEMLKMKQNYEERCDGYKDARDRMHRKLKEKEELVVSLQGALEARPAVEGEKWAHRPGDDSEDYARAKSLENTNKYNFKDLSATLQPGDIKKKLADIVDVDEKLYSVDTQLSPGARSGSQGKPEAARTAIRSRDEINDFLQTHKASRVPRNHG